jgi:hypothetical protein
MDNKVLILDIETSPIVAYVWDLKEQYVALNQIKHDWFVMAWSAKWLGDSSSKIVYHDMRHKPHGADQTILVPLWKLLDEADVVITQNGKRFDGPKINARFMLNGMPPPSPYKHLDTYQLVKNVAKFTSNRLEYLTEKFCVKHKKITHGKYPGMALWKECLKGNIAAWNEMKRYNISDVLSTEELYLKIKAWAPQSMPTAYHTLKTGEKCRVCGSTNIQKRGVLRNIASVSQRFQCKDCGHWSLQRVKS